ncbi:hypothetical protein [Litchfieldia salsa]|uniref:Uncharacterized protein n=1 Tax=Litchfieldia salsa TaxID=930152 RepID=A0A1H0VPF3_9BACI|nr:hypothetical protein [Litchfieldia salsa]SDP79956.1 hypothetical protein SAMN05216565_10798 [Litchfieldia salsa]
MYDKSLFVLGKVIDDLRAIPDYNDQVLKVIRSEYVKKNINLRCYEHLVNLLTCSNLRANEMKRDINDYIDRNFQKGGVSI